MSIKKVDYNFNLEKNMELLSKGAFLTTNDKDKTNSMTISWGSIGYMWNRPVFTVMVRPQRHTFELIESENEFTVSIPYNEMKEEIAFLGTKSGKDMDKLKELNINTVNVDEIETPILDFDGAHFVCKIVYKREMTEDNLDKEINDLKYPGKDYHTLYFGEIVGTYIKE